MKSQSHHSLQVAALALLSAFLFVALYQFNAWLFAALEHAAGVNWVFLPAGFRVLLVLAMGIPGAVGIVLGNLWLGQEELSWASLLPTVLIGLASGFSPWLVKTYMETRGQLDKQLRKISSAALLQFVLLYSAFNAFSHQAIHWLFHTPNTTPWVDVWPMFIGDAVGALVVLYTIKLLVVGLRQLQPTTQL